MRTNTVVTLIIALVFGGLAVFVANLWLISQSRKTEPVTAEVAPVETQTIVVAASDVGYGTVLVPELLREIPWPKASLPDGAFSKISEITTDGRRVVLTPISPNEPVLKWKISGPDARASLSALVTPGMRAVALRVNDVVGVGGFVLPGDRVDVLYSKSDDSGQYTDILLQNVRVLAVNQIADQKKSEPVVASVATVEVTTVDAQKIALAQRTGEVSLTLRAAGSLDQAKPQKVVEQELVSSPSVYMDEFNARAAAQAALDARLTQIEQRVTETVDSRDALEKKLAALEQMVRDASAATGQGEEALRAQLAALEADIKKASGADEAAMRAKLAEFEAALRKLTNQPQVVANAEQVVPVTEQEPTTVTVGVTRGTNRTAYEVPLDLADE